MYSQTKQFSISNRDNILYGIMHEYIYKNITTSSECEVVLDIGGEESGGTGLYAAAHNYNVIIFEPDRKQHLVTSESIQLNSFHDICVTSLNMLVSNGGDKLINYSKNGPAIKKLLKLYFVVY